MLELRSYSLKELSAILGSKSKQSVKNKLERYGIKYSEQGRAENTVYTIEEIEDEFKVMCILDLKAHAGTDFDKLLFFLYYLFNEPDFKWLPNERLEHEMDKYKHHLSRQTIGKYKKLLAKSELIMLDTFNSVYYFALGDTQIETDKETYCKAWSEYWEIVNHGGSPSYAISEMRKNYGGIARKQPVIEFNAFQSSKIDALNALVFKTINSKIS